MGNGALAIGPKLPRPSSTLPDRRFAAAHHSFSCSAYKRTMRGDRESVEGDPDPTLTACVTR